ncbi:hypothetical protein JCGZ_20476 [Jatropha curcas]|uniref:Glycosyltransferase n=1 Tax=Jatropha curcas TaxID=180498 RepID=A0A067JZ96_JATCU|nr:hydroquinone glucosyltransferase [Jatropha curcas]KDP25320.1 hypothetical protein JCGZ_20476 [Jatropha curcas]
MDTTQEAPPHVAIVPTPGMGHLIPVVVLAKKLIDQHNFSVTFIIPNDGSPMKSQRQLLQRLPNAISSIFLPPVSFDDLPVEAKIENRILLSLSRSLSHLRRSFKTLTESTRVVALVVDLFGTDAIELIAKEFDVLPFVFFPTTAMALSLTLHLPKLDQMYSCEYRDSLEPFKIPGCVPVQGKDLVDMLQDRNDDAYKRILHISKQYPLLVAGVLVNSFIDLEKGAFKALMEDNHHGFPIYPVGPLIRTGSEVVDESDPCLKWLNQQPKESVLFVSFGSGGTLSHDQLNELALGLEMSGKRFLWVVRCAHDKAVNATYFGLTNTNSNYPSDFLPEGFLDRTKNVGLVVSSWAPQVQILSHGSTGGFLTHCGWNSTLESIVHGVPLIAWPLYAEQKMNAVLLAEDLKVALRVKLNENGLVGSEDIAKYAKAIIEGEEGKVLRNKMKELQNGAIKVLSQDGSSTKSLADAVNVWKNHKK